VLPLATDMDRVDATPARTRAETTPWDEAAHALLERMLEAEPVLVRISVAKQMRDRAERDARQAGESRVSVERLKQSMGMSKRGLPA
jgi:3,8-divinyl chlorophyllide a/chlorophyllide a reductase subunit Z